MCLVYAVISFSIEFSAHLFTFVSLFGLAFGWAFTGSQETERETIHIYF